MDARRTGTTLHAPKGMVGPNLANVGARSYIAAGTLKGLIIVVLAFSVLVLGYGSIGRAVATADGRRSWSTPHSPRDA